MKEISHKNIIGSVTTFRIEGNGDRGTLLHTDLKNGPQTALILIKQRISAIFTCGICGAVCRTCAIYYAARKKRKEQIQQIATSMMKFRWVKNSFALSRARYQHQHKWMVFGNTESVYKEQHECILLGKNHDSLIHWTCALLLSMLCVTKDNI